MNRLLGVFILILAPIHLAHAFNGSRCARLFDPPKYMGKAEQSFMKMLYSTSSVFQFFTSTGKCKMLGGVSSDEKMQFVAHNSDHIKKNVIRAEGDYLTAMTFLYGCDLPAYEGVALRIQESTEKIFGSKLEYDPSRVSSELDSFMKTDPKIRQICPNTNV
jgi:hypothetical protein